jgi:methylglutaconyl-CoA hydratase
MSFQHIETHFDAGIYRIRINRPEVHNALNADLVHELIQAMNMVKKLSSCRVVLLEGAGPSFCAGADIRFVMDAHGTASLPAFGERLQELLFELVHCRQPVVTKVHGAVYGGALGLLAASDIVISAADARFSFSETKIGMVPAAILPFVNKRIGTTPTRYLMLTARVFDIGEALGCGLVNQSVPAGTLDQAVNNVIHEILQSSPEATALTKQLINAVDNRNVLIDSATYTINFYDNINKSPFVKEGLQAFREKRKPSWAVHQPEKDA